MTILYSEKEKVLEIWHQSNPKDYPLDKNPKGNPSDKKITLYLLPGSTEYLKSWGINPKGNPLNNIHLEMEDGEFADSEAADRVAELWDWLHQ